MAGVHFYPEFARQYEELCEDSAMVEIAGEVSQLIDALEAYGHEIEGEDEVAFPPPAGQVGLG